MNNKLLFTRVLAGMLATSLVSVSWAAAPDVKMITQKPAMKMTTPIPQSIMTPNQVDTSIGSLKYFDGVPDKATVNSLYDYMDRARAVQAYVSTVPGVSNYAMRQGQRDIGATRSTSF